MNVAQLLNAFALAALYVLLSVGLTLIFGLRDVMNFAHGALYMLGAYLASTIAAHSNFWIALIGAPLVLAILGLVFELAMVRRLTHRGHIIVALITFGVAIIIQQSLIIIYGSGNIRYDAPPQFNGSVDVLGTPYPSYRILLIGVIVIISVALGIWLRFTRSGMYVRASSHDPITARMVGVNSNRLGLLVVCLSTAMAGLAGAFAGPYQGVQPAMGDTVMIVALVIVIIGGIGSMAGAVIASLLVGFIEVLGTVEFQTFASITPYVLLLAVLILRPQGLMPVRELE